MKARYESFADHLCFYFYVNIKTAEYGFDFTTSLTEEGTSSPHDFEMHDLIQSGHIRAVELSLKEYDFLSDLCLNGGDDELVRLIEEYCDHAEPHECSGLWMDDAPEDERWNAVCHRLNQIIAEFWRKHDGR